MHSIGCSNTLHQQSNIEEMNEIFIKINRIWLKIDDHDRIAARGLRNHIESEACITLDDT